MCPVTWHNNRRPKRRLGLNNVVTGYTQRSGILLSVGEAASGGAGGPQGAMIKEFIKFQADQEQLTRSAY
jgi:hypothetical protein